VADTPSARGRWALRHVPPTPRSIVELIRSGTLDAELAAVLWLLVEARVPIIVAGPEAGSGRSTLLDALLVFLPPTVRVIELAGAEERFEWLPQAGELGWTRPRPDGSVDSPGGPVPNPADEASVPRRGAVGPEADPVRPDTTVLFAAELSDGLPSYTWGAEARLAIRAVSVGYGLAATIAADRLEDVFTSLRRPPVGADEDELSRLGVAVIVRRLADGRRRVTAAHYIRPTARDEHGHVQRLGPAVLSTWDADHVRFEHFGWGVTPELALRVGRKAGDFELEVDRRRDLLAGLAAAGIVDGEAVRAAIAGHRDGASIAANVPLRN
jgi:hypothetical protein